MSYRALQTAGLGGRLQDVGLEVTFRELCADIHIALSMMELRDFLKFLHNHCIIKNSYFSLFLSCFSLYLKGPSPILSWYPFLLSVIWEFIPFLCLPAVCPCPACCPSVCPWQTAIAVGLVPQPALFNLSCHKANRQAQCSPDCWHYHFAMSFHRTCESVQVDGQKEEQGLSYMRRLSPGSQGGLLCVSKSSRSPSHVSLLLLQDECGCEVYAAASLFKANYITTSALAPILHSHAHSLNQPAAFPGCLPQRLPPRWDPGMLPILCSPGFFQAHIPRAHHCGYASCLCMSSAGFSHGERNMSSLL